MALQQCRLGSITDALQWDDGDYTSAIETDQTIKAGTPIDGNDVLRLDDVFPDIINLITTQSYFFARIY